VLRRRNEALEAQVDRAQHLADMGLASYMIAHELNNLLTPVGTYAELALHNADDAALTRKALEKAVANCRRASKVIEGVLALAGEGRLEKQTCRVKRLVEGVFDCLCRDFSKDAIELVVEIPEELEIYAAGVQIQHVLMNLVLNARDAMLGRGGILRVVARDAGDSVEIEVADTGEGIAAANLDRIFAPFFSTKTEPLEQGPMRGAGLGLAFCSRVVEAHGGTISVESKPSQGTTFRIALPKRQ